LQAGRRFASLQASRLRTSGMATPDDVFAPEAAPAIEALPRHTTPTWEVELLISGVAVFAMLQLPGWLDDRWFALAPRLTAEWANSLELVYIYAKAASLILAATFVLHLLLRARWIAQVGMHSVHPDGIRWERLRLGPVQREIEQELYGGAEVSMDRADNRATTVFAIGVTLASLLLTIMVVLLATFVVLYVAGRWIAWKPPVFAITVWVTALLFLPMLLGNRIDRSAGAMLGVAPRRLLGALFRFYGALGFGRGRNPALALAMSNAGRRRTALLVMGLMLAAYCTVLLSYKAERDPNRLGDYALFPHAPGLAGIDATHYDDTRNPARDGAVPFVQSAVVTGPYLRLVVPYQPAGDDEALRRECTAQPASRTARAKATLACLQRLHPVSLDGRLLDPRYEPGSDPRTDRPALIAMIDVRSLGPGRHELYVGRFPPTSEPADASYRIPFWR
jgi:hypothetical protein